MKEQQHFLKILGLKHKKPTYEFLEKILKVHMQLIPFETISKLYYYKSKGLKYIPSFSLYLEGIEKYKFGGTCYSNNYYLNLLLNYLGFDADLCGADMSSPNVHIANIVKIDSKEYIIDTGYAAPFIKPIHRDSTEDKYIEFGEDSYIIKPKDAKERSQIVMYRNNELKHGYLLNPIPKQIEDFDEVIINSFRSEAAFINSILLTKFNVGSSLRIHNLKISEIKGKIEITKSIASKDELYNQIFLHFGIPIEILQTTLEDMHLDQDAWT